jgi:hypothetical protein
MKGDLDFALSFLAYPGSMMGWFVTVIKMKQYAIPIFFI